MKSKKEGEGKDKKVGKNREEEAKKKNIRKPWRKFWSFGKERGKTDNP